MTTTEYWQRAKRLKWIGSLIFVVIGGGLTIAISLLLDQSAWFATWTDSLRGRIHPGLVGVVGILPLLPFFLLPAVVPIAIIAWVDRRLGVVCPHCGKSLTMRCLPAEVVKTKCCQLCGGNVLEAES